MSADGCEFDTSTDVNNCGNCGAVCNLANATEVCTSSACAIASCTSGYFDVDAVAANGCECLEGTPSAACTTPISLGSLGAGASALGPVTNIVAAGGADWYSVSYPFSATFLLHGAGTPQVVFSRNDGAAFAFEVRVPGCPGAPFPLCGGTLTSWQYSDTCVAGGTNCSTRNSSWPGSVYIRVFRITGGASCGSYQLSVSR